MKENPARSPRFHIAAPLRARSVCALPEDAAHHAIHVLRLHAGDGITLFDGRGGEYAARIASIVRWRVALEVLEHRAVERAETRRAHWRKVAISACEQCGRNRVPEVHPLAPVADYLGRAVEGSLKLLLSPRAELAFSKSCMKIDNSVTLAAGPEAGFTAEEEAALAAAGFIPAALGPRVLRAETAALAALAALSALRGDF